MDGDRSDQKDADTITPAAKPNIASIIDFFIFLKKNTKAAPKAVTNQVKHVARKTWIIGFNSIKKLLKINLPLEQIMELTELTEEEIKNY